MESTYQSMRTFADSWGLLYMFVIFVIAVLWTFRPGSKKHSEDAARIPFNEDENHGRK
ncbi:cbb3-type cytochrome c oxidase subunit 3 [Pararhizobium sp. IMCC21322]|uniref:cbb3-type cytochrome c oxidase subunit 3 n=1 Tax=Pararhizobium sp. IMCC21322 TaxID=3067903 RepID=UPI0027408EF4|nr:cbb3-type cytochrome c oxidase subunit 3 [Pararhizobium sp. IMCC21322]